VTAPKPKPPRLRRPVRPGPVVRVPTLAGRVAAIEARMARIEERADRIVSAVRPLSEWWRRLRDRLLPVDPGEE
jgi:hypothetical protein